MDEKEKSIHDMLGKVIRKRLESYTSSSPNTPDESDTRALSNLISDYMWTKEDDV